MYTKKAAMFLYSVSPVHMGAGTALGAIDNPIQRERHTGHPVMAGSGLKGALRHDVSNRLGDDQKVTAIFGPDTKSANASDHAGALSVSDGQVVLFPVRSLRGSFVYATCPTVLRRLERLLQLAGHPPAALPGAEPDTDRALVTEKGARELVAGKEEELVLEAYAFKASQDQGVTRLADWLSDFALRGDGMDYFKAKIRDHLVVLHDDRFNYFVRNATVVEPHVRIDDHTGTADEGGLFYTENVPPESLFISLVMASPDRRPAKEGESKAPQLEAADVVSLVADDLDTRMIQVGGDATTGRGQVVLTLARG